MKNQHIYETTYERLDADGEVTLSTEVQLTFTYTPGAPDTYNASIGGPGGWDQGYGPEIEIVQVKQLEITTDTASPPKWVGTSLDSEIIEWADEHLIDHLIQSAFNDLLDAKERAIEAHAESRAESFRDSW